MFKIGLSFLIIISTISMQAQSEEDNFYAGVKAGYSNFSGIDWKMVGSGTWDVENTEGFGLLAGYKIKNSLSLEFEYMEFESKTETEPANLCGGSPYSCTSPKIDYETNTYSLYFAYRTQGTVFFKGRLGYAYQEHEFSKGSFNLPTAYDSGVSGSVGIGTDINKITLEANYTYVTEELSYYSVGALYNF